MQNIAVDPAGNAYIAGVTRKPTILFLLFLGVFNTSVAAFEAASTELEATSTEPSFALALEYPPDYRYDSKINNIRDAHRQRVIDFKASNRSVSRSSLAEVWPATYKYLRKHDAEWLYSAIPRKRRGGMGTGTTIRRRLDRAQLDASLAEELKDIINEMKSPSKRPIRVTKSGVLRRAASLTKYLRAPAEFPLTEAVIREHVETKADYLVRKIRWAIAEIAKAGQEISVDILRRKSGIEAPVVRQHKELVLKATLELEASIEPRSFFAVDT